MILGLLAGLKLLPSGQDLLLALLLPLPPWLGFLIYRQRGRVGLAFGYFLGGILALLALPWPGLGGQPLPTAHLGGALFGFTLFLQAHREGRKGLRSLALGVGGGTGFGWLIGTHMGLDMRSVPIFWATALLEAALWLGLSDLGHRLTRGRWLYLRMPLAGGAALLTATALFRVLPLGIPHLSWLASLFAGCLFGLVALQQLAYLRAQGIWVEGRGNGFRVALSALERDQPPDGPTLAYVIDARQAMMLVNDKGMLLETNTAFSRMAGLPRHQIKGYLLQDLFQGRDAAAWDDLQAQLLRDSRGSAQVTLVHRDSSFQNVRLEAVAFDRNMALVWIADPQPGTLALRGDGSDAVIQDNLASQDAQRQAATALAAILPAVEQILGETWNIRTRDAAERIIVAAQRLLPESGNHALAAAVPQLPAQPALEAMLPRLQLMLGAGQQVALRSPAITLFIEPEPLQRLVTQLVLHGRQALTEGCVTVTLTPVTLGHRTWARMGLDLGGARPGKGDFLGLTWLQQTIREALGMLEMVHDRDGFLWPRIYLPCKSPEPDPGSTCLQGHRIWILDRDPDVREALATLVRDAGGEARAFPELARLLEGTRKGPMPDLLVLERTPALERFHNRLRRLERKPLPALILGDGRALPTGEGAPSRLILLEKPFPGQNFLQCLLALLQDQ